MPEQHWGVEPKVLPHLVKVVQVRRERNVLWPNVLRGSPAPALIVVDKAKLIFELIQIGQEVTMVEIGPAVQDDDRLSSANRSDVERCAANQDAALACIHAGIDLLRRITSKPAVPQSAWIAVDPGTCGELPGVHERLKASAYFLGSRDLLK
jgi:hypothetical protein